MTAAKFKIISDMPFEEYAALPAWNASKLKVLAHSYHAYSCYISSDDNSAGGESVAFRFGRAVHALVLEGIEPTGRHAASVKLAADRLLRNPDAKKLLNGAETELTLLWEDEDWGDCKARLDLYRPDLKVIGDLKVMAADGHDPVKFGYSSVKFGYDIQALWYMRAARACGLDADSFKFIVLEKGWYDSSILNVSRGMLAAGESELMFASQNLKSRKDSGEKDYFGGRYPGEYDVEHRYYKEL